MNGFTSGTLVRRIADHHPDGWFTPGAYPSCSCGFAPRDNAKLIEHWRNLGFRWVDHGGVLGTESGLRDNPILAAYRYYVENFGDDDGSEARYRAAGTERIDARGLRKPEEVEHARRVLSKLAVLA